MIRRWLIRGLALTLLTLCVVAWVGSYWEAVVVQHDGDKLYSLNVDSGRVLAVCYNLSAYPPIWDAGFYDPLGIEWDARTGKGFLGFTFGASAGYAIVFSVTVPLWFLTAVSAIHLWLIWRKTRPKYLGNAFPVEPAKSGETRP